MIPKRVLKKYLYEFQVPISYKKTQQVIDACVNDTPLPVNVLPDTLMRIKRALESCRRSEGRNSVQQAHAEQELVEKAAELGDRSAVALLCYSRLVDPDCTTQDRKDGSKLLKQLIEQKFPLALKVSADLAYKMGHPEAYDLYKQALNIPGLDARTRTECWRSRGHIAFKARRLVESLYNFSQACQESTDPSQVSDCHFYLAQLRESDREAARKHLELAAASGLSDAFLPLGMLLLNYFDNPKMAKDWLKLALVTDTTGSAALGLLDVASQTNDQALGKSAASRIINHKNAEQLVSLRPNAIKQFYPKPHSYRPGAGRWDTQELK